MNKLKTIPFESKKVGIYEISFDEHNVRKITKKGFKRLKDKITRGMYEPIKVWKKDMSVISGNQRLAVIRSLVEDEGYDIEKVDIMLYDVTKEMASFIAYADNEHDGETDIDKVIEEFDNIKEMGLIDVLDPKLVAKIEANLNTSSVEEESIEQADRNEDDIMEVGTTDLVIVGLKESVYLRYNNLITHISRESDMTEREAFDKILSIVEKELHV